MFFDQRISSRTMLSRTLWQQGFPDQARDCAQEGLALARSIDHALSLCFVLAHGVVPIALWRGEKTVAEDMTQLLLKHSQEHGFFIWLGFGRAYHAALNPDAKRTLAGPARPAMGALLLETLATLDETFAATKLWRVAQAAVPDGLRPNCFASAVGACFGLARKSRMARRRYCFSRSIRRGSRRLFPGNCEQRSVSPRFGRRRAAAIRPSTCWPQHKIASRKGLLPLIS